MKRIFLLMFVFVSCGVAYAGPGSSLISPVTIKPTGGNSNLAFGTFWEFFTGSGGLDLFDTESGFAPIICFQVPGNPSIDNCNFIGFMVFQNNAGGQVVFQAPPVVNSSPTGFRVSSVPPSAVAGGYWFDEAGDGNLTENVPTLAVTSAPFNHGGVNIPAGSCESESPTTLAGVTDSMTCLASPVTRPGAGFTWDAVCDNGSVTVSICNISATDATPASSAYNIRAIK